MRGALLAYSVVGSFVLFCHPNMHFIFDSPVLAASTAEACLEMMDEPPGITAGRFSSAKKQGRS